MPSLVALGGPDGNKDWEPERRTNMPQSRNSLRALFINDGLLYYWATDPTYWYPQNTTTKAALDRRLTLITPLLQDLDEQNPSSAIVEKFWLSYAIFRHLRTGTIRLGKTTWSIGAGSPELKVEMADPALAEKVTLIGKPDQNNPTSLPKMELTLRDPHPSLMQIYRNTSFPITSATVFSRFVAAYPQVRRLSY